MNKITLLHQFGIPNYFMKKMHGQTTLKKYTRTVYHETLRVLKINETFMIFYFVPVSLQDHGYVPETCLAKNALIKLPSCIKLAFQVIS